MTTASTLERPTVALLDRVRALLGESRPAEALELLGRGAQRGPQADNARGVCLLRLGRYDEAVRIFRDLLFPAGAFTIPEDAPTAWRVNYVTSLLLSGNITVGLSVLAEVPDRRHPAVVKLRAGLRSWKRQLGWLRRVLLAVGVCPDRPVTLGDRPGEL